MITSIENLEQWLELNGIVEWSLRTAKQNDANSFVFKSDSTQDKQKEIERMKKVLSVSSSPRLYLFAKKGSQTTGNFGEILELPVASAAITPQNTPQTIGYTPDDLERRIAQAIHENNFKWERERFEQDRKQFLAEKREFQKTQEGVVGILIEKAAPIIGALLSKGNPLRHVAGVPEGATLEAEPIRVKRTDEAAHEAEAEQSAFTDEEADQLFNLMERLKAKDTDYIKILEKIVLFAESDKPVTIMGFPFSYDKLKDMILNFEI